MTTPEWIAAEVLRLYHAERWKRNTIARQLGIHHSAVARILARNGARLPPPTRTTKVDKYLPLIPETLERYPTLCATRLLEMCRARGYTGQITQLRAAVRRLRPRTHAVAYLRLRTLPGEQAQVDWADFGAVQIGRARRKLMAFVMVLSWSRAVYRVFSEWPEVFPNAVSIVALADRLCHKAEVLTIDADSYRTKETLERNSARRPRRKA